MLANALFDRMVSVFPGFFLCVIKASEIARDKVVSRRGRNGAGTWGGGDESKKRTGKWGPISLPEKIILRIPGNFAVY